MKKNKKDVLLNTSVSYFRYFLFRDVCFTITILCSKILSFVLLRFQFIKILSFCVRVCFGRFSVLQSEIFCMHTISRYVLFYNIIPLILERTTTRRRPKIWRSVTLHRQRRRHNSSQLREETWRLISHDCTPRHIIAE